MVILTLSTPGTAKNLGKGLQVANKILDSMWKNGKSGK